MYHARPIPILAPMGRDKPSKGHSKKAGAGKARREPEPGLFLDRRYHGPDQLDRLLARAQSEVDTRGAIARLSAGLAEGKAPPEVFPTLFAREPRFAGPEESLALYGNLFGLWDLLEGGTDPEQLLTRAPPPPPEEAAEEEEPEEEAAPAVRAELPPRGSAQGDRVPAELVELVWHGLDELAPREQARRLDRYENVQSELAEWPANTEGLSGSGQETLALLCFELHEIFDAAFGDRLGPVRFREILAADPAAAVTRQPDLVAYVAQALDLAEAAELEPLAAEERPAVEEAALKAVVGLDLALRRSS